MDDSTHTIARIEAAVAAMPPGPLVEAPLQACVAPLFARHREATPERIYLANHSLGRPLDATADDVREGLAAWYAQQGDAWTAWAAEMGAYRAASRAVARGAARRLHRAEDQRRPGPARDSQHL